MVILFRLLLATGSNDYRCTFDCHGVLRSSLFKEVCCDTSNVGKAFKFVAKKERKYVFCPLILPSTCALVSPIVSVTSSSPSPKVSVIPQMSSSPSPPIVPQMSSSPSPPDPIVPVIPQNCMAILDSNPNAESSNYDIILSNGSIVNVYCDMRGVNCDQEGGWMRIAYLNMTEPGITCPSGLRPMTYSDISHTLCSKEGDQEGCGSVFYNPVINYTKVCGQVRGYQFGSPDGSAPYLGAFVSPTNPTIDGVYVDGVTITYGNNPRRHLWTYMAGLSEHSLSAKFECPCNVASQGYPPPSYVGSDYYCESGNPNFAADPIFHADDPLWDGELCRDADVDCCTSDSLPWFTKTLIETVSDHIEVRLCQDEAITNEDVPVDIIEIFVR